MRREGIEFAGGNGGDGFDEKDGFGFAGIEFLVAPPVFLAILGKLEIGGLFMIRNNAAVVDEEDVGLPVPFRRVQMLTPDKTAPVSPCRGYGSLP